MQYALRLLSSFLMLTWLTACRPNVEELVQQPEVGDVYVVQFQPPGSAEPRYYLYQVQAVRPDAVDVMVARQDAATPDADVKAPGFFSNKVLTYSRAEALALLHEQPGDVQHARLVEVKR